MERIITCGPFVGSFFEEITNFRPFVQWVERNLVYDDLFVFTHLNRKFLYDNNVIPIWEQYSLDDGKQHHHLNHDINQKLYNMISKSLRNDVLRITGSQPKEIISLFSKYPKNRIRTLLFNKQFNRISNDSDMTSLKDTIAYIPSKQHNKKKLKQVLTHLQNNYNVIVLGDSKIHFHELNYLNNSYVMWVDMFYFIVQIIGNVKAVICPVSDWTFLCNLQQVPVFSWGNGNIYKENGVYNFNNDNYIIPDTKVNNIITSIDRFLKGLDKVPK